jgi:hypothetical protein
MFDQYESLVRDLNALDSDGTMQGVQYHGLFGDMQGEYLIVQTSMLSCGMTTVVVFVVLLVATRNGVLAALSVASVAGILVSCLGFIRFSGWAYGFYEAICVTITTGFSCDFVVHIALGYAEASDRTRPSLPSRYERVRSAVGEMGVSITGAFLSTAGASLFMLGSPLVPFQKMGKFIAFNVCISYVTAVLFFPALCRLVGPVQAPNADVGMETAFELVRRVAGGAKTRSRSTNSRNSRNSRKGFHKINNCQNSVVATEFEENDSPISSPAAPPPAVAFGDIETEIRPRSRSPVNM